MKNAFSVEDQCTPLPGLVLPPQSGILDILAVKVYSSQGYFKLQHTTVRLYDDMAILLLGNKLGRLSRTEWHGYCPDGHFD